jgi:hypothetical protein
MAGSTSGSRRRTSRPGTCGATPRATILVAESDPPLRAVEVRGRARFIEDGVPETALRIVTRYESPEDAAADVDALGGADVIIRIEPGDIRVWDYADEFRAG